MMMARKHLALGVGLLAGMLVAGGCSDDCTLKLKPTGTAADDQTNVQAALINAQPGDVVCLGSGRYFFTDEVSLAVENVTLRGKSDSIWDFSGQVRGANGLHVMSDGVTLEGFTVLNPPGDGVRATLVKNLVMRGLTVRYEAEGNSQNGAYALYPVQSDGVLIEDCVAEGATDFGIYLGQSKNAIIRGNEAYKNVGGIEVENSTDVDVYDNYVHDNAAGFLAANLPELPAKGNSGIRVFTNRFENNNFINFAPQGTLVSQLSQGSGLLILASDRVEVYENSIAGNQSVGVGILSYHVTQRPYNDPAFDLYPETNYVHDNQISGNGMTPDEKTTAVVGQPGPVADILWDGVIDSNKDHTGGALTNCLERNGDATYMNFDLGKTGSKTTDPSGVTCAHQRLPGVTR